jgi:hypothetical protein
MQHFLQYNYPDVYDSVEITNKMQPCNKIYYSTLHWRLNMFRAAQRSSSGALTVFAASGLRTHVVTDRSQVWVGAAFMYSSTCFWRPHTYRQELNNCSSSLWFYRWSVVVAVLLFLFGPARTRTTGWDHHDTKVKPVAATAVVELLTIGMRTPQTCWAVNKRQDNKTCKTVASSWLIFFNCTMMYGLANFKFKKVSYFVTQKVPYPLLITGSVLQICSWLGRTKALQAPKIFCWNVFFRDYKLNWN